MPEPACRRAAPEDAPAILQLIGALSGERSTAGACEDGASKRAALSPNHCGSRTAREEDGQRAALPGMDLDALSRSLACAEEAWLLASLGQAPSGAMVMDVDMDQGLAKIRRVFAAPGADRACEALWGFLAQDMESREGIDAVYCTTRTLAPAQMALALGCGFKALGVFPGAPGLDPSGVNGLAALFRRGVLGSKRRGRFPLHPALKILYDRVKTECGLDDPPLAALDFPPGPSAGLPPLEALRAPLFAARRFENLRRRKSLSVNFYPFQTPNVMITDPDQKIEIFARIYDDLRFATVIGERLEAAVDPVKLCRAVVDILRSQGAEYVEAINDAADARGVDALLRASFEPCAYFPGLKRHGSSRRDFTVFARSFASAEMRPAQAHPAFRKFLDPAKSSIE
ncbi:MAG: hypothetical protein HY922_02165 [Elusimicrobia bacterium]|nr:hypothetical protein [Elusimicrobiota bacterium]